MSKKTHYPPAPFVFMDLRSTELSADEEKFLSHRLLAGIVLFSRNYENPEQLLRLLQKVRSINPGLLFSVDQEGGRVQRFKSPFTPIPSMKKLAQHYLLDENEGRELVKDCAWLVGSELAALGIDINFAPVLDLDVGRNIVIGDRAFGALSSMVTALGAAYLEGIKKTKVLPVAKHFPGHGGVSLDSHIAQPIDNRSFEVLWETDMAPFRELAKNLPAVMMSHVIYALASPMPAGYCTFWIKDILRRRLQFSGLVFSDCLSMKAAEVSGSVVKRIRLAYLAGCDYVLSCNQKEDYFDILEALEDAILSHEPLPLLSTYRSHLAPPMPIENSMGRWQVLQASERYRRIKHRLEDDYGSA